MAGPRPRHPVAVCAAALVQTGCFQTFAFSVRWSDGSDSFVRRTWDEFRRLHSSQLPETSPPASFLQKILKETFPEEAGLLRSSDRVLPKLRDAPLMARGGRTSRGVARLHLLEAYSRSLLAAAEHVFLSSVLVGFFAPHPSDLEPTLPPGSLVVLPAAEDPPARPTGSLTIRRLEAQRLRCLHPFRTQDTRGRPFHTRAQETLDVLLRHPSGWWLVENKDKQTAWFPAPYLEVAAPAQAQEGDPVPPLPGPHFCASRAYEGCHADELSVPAGARVRVLQTSDRGWWLCRSAGRVGLLPAVLLRPDALGALLSPPALHAGAAAGETPALEARDTTPGPRAAPRPPPAVPARPAPSAIWSRCCTITRGKLEQAVGARGHLEGAEAPSLRPTQLGGASPVV